MVSFRHFSLWCCHPRLDAVIPQDSPERNIPNIDTVALIVSPSFLCVVVVLLTL